VLEFRVKDRVRVKVRAMVRLRDYWGTKRLGTKRLWYEMRGSQRVNAGTTMTYPSETTLVVVVG